MLENPALIIGPVCVGPEGVFRTIHDSDSSILLGQVFRTPRITNPWLVKTQPRTETVYETQDRSLLCLTRRRWWFGEVDVLDSEQQLVAILRRRHVLAIDGQLLAKRSPSLVPNEEIFHTPQGVEFASVAHRGETQRLNFHPRIAAEPLLKMAILGAVLFM